MQQARTEDRIEYASLGWRIAAVAVDTAVLFAILTLVATVWVFVLAAQGRIDPNDPAAAQTLARDVAATPNWVANTALFGTLFIYYVVLEGIVGASVGKLVFHMRVVMRDGSRPTGVAIVVRNLVRILEAYPLYIPAGISCLASSRRQRLGDHAARMVVVRRAAGGRPTQAPPTSAPWAGGTPPAPPPPQTASGTWTAPPAPLSGPEEDASTSSPADAVSALKTATLAARGAHLAYLHFSERELATGASDEAGGYSDEYVSAWLTLTDAVAAFRSAHAAAVAAAAGSGRTLEEACAGQPDLLHVLQTLEPYLAAESDDQVHEAFLTVARSELPDS